MTIFGAARNEMDRFGGGFEGISKTCPWREALQCTGQVSLNTTTKRVWCKKENCALWHWLYAWYEAMRLKELEGWKKERAKE